MSNVTVVSFEPVVLTVMYHGERYQIEVPVNELGALEISIEPMWNRVPVEAETPAGVLSVESMVFRGLQMQFLCSKYQMAKKLEEGE